MDRERHANGTQPNLAQQVVRHIYKQVQNGTLIQDDKLPTNRALAEELGVSILTVQRAMKQMEAQGTVSCHRRTGTFLRDPSSITSPKIQSGLIGLFSPEIFSDFHTDLLIELENGMLDEGKLVSINFTHSQPEREIILLRSLARQRLEALVYFTSPLVISSETHRKTVSKWIERYIEEGTFVLFADLCPPGFENRLISLDNEKAGRMLTEKLIHRGHQKISFIGATHLPSSQKRLDGHEHALKTAGLSFDRNWNLDIRLLEGDNWQARMETRIRKLLTLHPDLTGFTVSTQAAAQTLYKILQELPPREFAPEESIASIFETGTPPFEAVAWMQVPGKEMGRKVVEILLQNHQADYEPGHIKIPPVFWKPPQ